MNRTSENIRYLQYINSSEFSRIHQFHFHEIFHLDSSTNKIISYSHHSSLTGLYRIKPQKGKNIFEVLSLTTFKLQELQAAIQKAIKGNIPKKIEFCIESNSKHLQVSIVPAQENQYILGITDITTEKHEVKKRNINNILQEHLWQNKVYGYVILNSKGIILKCNDTFSKIIEQEKQVVNDSVFNYLLLHGSSKKEFVESYKNEFLKKVLPSHGQYQVILANGKTKTLEVRTNFLEAEDDSSTLFNVPEIFCECLDITENEKERDQDLYLLNCVSAPIIISDKCGKILKANCSALTFFKFNNPQEIINKDVIDLFVTRDSEKITRLVTDTLQSGKAKAVMLECKRKDGTTFLSECDTSLLTDHSGGTNIFFTLKDVEESKLIQKILFRSFNLFKFIWNTIPKGMTLLNKDGIILAVNKTFCSIFENEEYEFIGKNYKLILSDNKYDVSESSLEKLFNDKKFLPNSYSTKNLPSGKKIDIAVEHNIVNTGNDDFLILQSFTEIKRDQQFDDQKNELYKLQTIGSLVNHIVHKLKNPLTSIGIAAELLKEDTNNPDQLNLFNIIDKQIKRSNNYLKLISQFARDGELDRKAIYLHYIIEHVHQVFNPVFEEKNITFTNLTDKNRIIFGDEHKLFLCFEHLVENSADAIKMNGSISIYDKIDLKNNFIKIYVKDSGTGISDIEKLYELFFSTKSNGLGFGMAIARDIIEAHDGKMMLVHSVPGETIFEITLPLSE